MYIMYIHISFLNICEHANMNIQNGTECIIKTHLFTKRVANTTGMSYLYLGFLRYVLRNSQIFVHNSLLMYISFSKTKMFVECTRGTFNWKTRWNYLIDQFESMKYDNLMRGSFSRIIWNSTICYYP